MQIQGLITQKPGRDPQVGEVKCFTVEQRTSVSGKAWTKLKNSIPDKGGSMYKILSVKPTGFEDQHGNISFNLSVEPTSAAPTMPATRSGTAPATKEPVRPYLMRCVNLLRLCHDAAKALDLTDGEDARSLFITMQREGYVPLMPDRPMKEEAPVEHPELIEEEPNGIIEIDGETQEPY